MPAAPHSPIPTYVGEVTCLGGGVRAYADASGVQLTTYDQVGPWTTRPVATKYLTTADAMGRHLAHVAPSPTLVQLLADAWAAHLEAVEATRTVTVELVIEVEMPGASA